MGCSQYHNGLNKIDLNKTSELALENKPEILSNNRDIQAGQCLSNTAFELPKTGVKFQYGNTDGFEYNDGIRISQNIPFPTLFGARKNLVSEQVKGRQWAKSLTENELDRKSVVEGKSVSVRVDLGGRRIITTIQKNRVHYINTHQIKDNNTKTQRN